ncbi:MAG: hypothetical protein LBI99_02950 [Propionibacteriaceae bacterium]|jgi:hypothetical protein|nr:hypothetical protein [Propionibacteriaceae bacterium]
MLVFIALREQDLPSWAGGQPLGPVPGFAVTAAMVRAFGFDGPTDEAAEYTALNICGLAGLLRNGSRLVAVVEAEVDQTDDEFGETLTGLVDYHAVTALFAPAIADPDFSGMSLADAWDDPDVQEAITANPLGWYAPSEWNTLAP